MTIKGRIEKLEKRIVAAEPKITVIVVVHDGQPEPTQAQKEVAIERYKLEHPDWQARGMIVLEFSDLVEDAAIGDKG